MPVWVIADDNDPSMVYNGQWQILTGSTRQYNSAVHSTAQPGATVTFRFRGTQIAVFGTIPVGPGTTSAEYELDGMVVLGRAFKCPSDQPEYEKLFFQQDGLRDGDHTLVVRNLASDADFRVDRVEWMPTDEVGADKPLPPLPAPAPAPAPTPTPASTPTPTPRPSQPQPSLIAPSATTGTPTTTSQPIGSVSSESSFSSTTSAGETGATSATSESHSSRVVNTTGEVKNIGQETLVVKVTSSSVLLSGSGDGVDTLGATSALRLSKGALAGIIVGCSLAVLAFVFLFILLFNRRQRRRGLVKVPMGDAAFAPASHMKEARNKNLSPFDLATQRTSAFFVGLGASNPHHAPLPLDDNYSYQQAAYTHPGHSSTHKPPLRSDTTPSGYGNGSNPPSDQESSSTYSQPTLIPSESGGYLNQPRWVPTLHRPRNTSSIDLSDATRGSWGTTTINDVFGAPPPSYQAAVQQAPGSLGRAEGSGGAGQALPSSSKQRIDD